MASPLKALCCADSMPPRARRVSVWCLYQHLRCTPCRYHPR